MQIIGLKAPANYSGPSWINNCPLCLWQNPKALIFLMSGLLDVSPRPKTNILWDTRMLQKHQETSLEHFLKNYFHKSQIFGNPGDGTNIFLRTRNGNLVNLWIFQETKKPLTPQPTDSHPEKRKWGSENGPYEAKRLKINMCCLACMGYLFGFYVLLLVSNC